MKTLVSNTCFIIYLFFTKGNLYSFIQHIIELIKMESNQKDDD